MRNSLQNKSVFARFCLHILGISLCTLPPAVCTLLYFPIWKYNSEKALAGGVVILLIISAYPLFKLMKKRLASPASYTVWLIIFLAFATLSRIADEMTFISFWGLLGNLLGSVCFMFTKGRRNEK
jgi:hypothetical protein